MNAETITVTGRVNKILFRKEGSGWTKFLLQGRNGRTVSVTGIASDIKEGSFLELKGAYTIHPQYGETFKAESITHKVPTNRRMFADYLISQIDGIGRATAELLVKEFGQNTLEIVMNHPEKVERLPRISREKAVSFSRQMKAKNSSRNEQMLYLKLGISNQLQKKIKEKYGLKTEEVLTKNPYQLIDSIKGVGFQTADRIASKSGIPAESSFRIRSGIEYVLEKNADFGHSYLPEQVFVGGAARELKVKSQIIADQAGIMVSEGILVRQGENIYLKKYHDMEEDVAMMLSKLAKSGGRKYNDKDMEKVRDIEKEKGIQLDDIQRKAVADAVTGKVMVITGGPGTGKTTVLDVIIKYLKRHEKNGELILMAPTGKAAKRMHEQTGLEASTIHRTVLSTADREDLSELFSDMDTDLPVRGGDGEKLTAETVIVDESSMISLVLMKALLKIINPGTRLIIVGDVDQLPSIGVGQVLKDIINCGRIRVCRLENIYRQAADSHIIVNAHLINKGKFPDMTSVHDDFALIRNTDREKVIHFMKQMVSGVLPRKFGIRPNEVQILCPSNKGVLGVEECNEIMQEFLNPQAKGKDEFDNGTTRFRTGDKVMQTKNNYEIEWYSSNEGRKEEGMGVFNGEVGFIEGIDRDSETVRIIYEDRTALYSYDDMKNLTLAYAMTIHKSQGSEYPAVVMPLVSCSYPKLYTRNLLYTGITRARQSIVLMGDPAIVRMMIRNSEEEERYSTLAERIRASCP